jgi:hypothetical protein
MILSFLALTSSKIQPSITAAMKRIDLVKVGGFKANENIVAVDAASPEPAADRNQVVIDVKASAINPVDWKMAEYGFLLPESLPAALGCDIAGVVVKASDGCKDMIGKRVVAYTGADKTNHATDRGTFVEQVVMDADVVGEIPDTMSFTQASTLPVAAMTGALLLNALNLSSGSLVLVWGASSSVGFNTVQLALKRDLKPIAVASGKHEAGLKALGVSGFVDYTKNDVEQSVKVICGNEKLSGAVDCIGTESTFGTCARLVGELGDEKAERVVSSVAPSSALPEPPRGVKKCSIDLATGLDNPDVRERVVKVTLPIMVELQTQPIRSVKGPFTAETVEEAFQANKSGVSGEKVVIEWAK